MTNRIEIDTMHAKRSLLRFQSLQSLRLTQILNRGPALALCGPSFYEGLTPPSGLLAVCFLRSFTAMVGGRESRGGDGVAASVNPRLTGTWYR